MDQPAPPQPTDWLPEVAALLGYAETACLATIDDAGRPYACNVNVAALEPITAECPPMLAFISSPRSAHAGHIAKRPELALTVYAHVEDWSQIHGIQAQGRCHRVDGEVEAGRWRSVWEAYTARFPFVAAVPKLRDRLQAEAFYVVAVDWLKFTDNRRGFGAKVEHRWA
jgi:hypothetical protein